MANLRGEPTPHFMLLCSCFWSPCSNFCVRKIHKIIDWMNSCLLIVWCLMMLVNYFSESDLTFERLSTFVIPPDWPVCSQWNIHFPCVKAWWDTSYWWWMGNIAFLVFLKWTMRVRKEICVFEKFLCHCCSEISKMLCVVKIKYILKYPPRQQGKISK